MRIRDGVFVWLASLALLAGAAPAPRGLEVSPPRVEVDLDSREFSSTVLFQNETDEPRALKLAVKGLGHDLDGVTLFLDEPPSGEFDISVREALLAPAEQVEVQVDAQLPDGSPGLYGAVVAEYDAGSSPDATVSTLVQLGSIFLIRGPRPWDEEVAPVRVEPLGTGAERSLAVVVENTGNVHVRPSGVLRLSAGGETVGVVELQPETILPGFARRLTGTYVGGPLPAGPIDVTVALDNPEASASLGLNLTPEEARGLTEQGRRAEQQRRVLIPLAGSLIILTLVLLATMMWRWRRRAASR